MSLTRRLLLGTGMMPLLGAPAGEAAAFSDLGRAGLDVRTFESFGAKGDAPDPSGRGTDDTRAIQAAIDWAYSDGKRLPRALFMGDRGYLCGNVTLHPTTTIIGTGRHTSMFVCKHGTRGAWFGTRGGGAHKIMLSGIAFYGRGEGGVSEILDLGTGPDEHPLGTESILEGLWMRDAPNGVALAVAGNVAILNDITCQNARIGIRARGNASHAQNLIIMQTGEGARSSQPVIGADLDGWFVRGLHIEATAQKGVPLRLRGNTHVLHAFISTVTGYEHDHLIEIDDSEYREWSLAGIRLSENRYTVKNGIIRHSSGYAGGRNARAFSGRSIAAPITGDPIVAPPAGLAPAEFVISLSGDPGGTRHAICAPGRPGLAASQQGPLVGISPRAMRTPLESVVFTAGGQISGKERSSFAFKLARPVSGEASGIAIVERNSSAVPVNVAIDFAGGGFALVFSHALTGSPVSLAELPTGAEIAVNVRALL